MSEQLNTPNLNEKVKAEEMLNIMQNIQTKTEEATKEIKKYGQESVDTKQTIENMKAAFKSNLAELNELKASNEALKNQNTNIEKALNRMPTGIDTKSVDDPRFEEFNKAWGLEMKNSLYETPIDASNSYDFKKLFEKVMIKGYDKVYAESNEMEQKKLQTIIDSQGGLFVVPQFMPQPIEKQFDENGVLRIVQTEQTNSPVVHRNVDYNDYSDGDFSHELTADDLDTDDTKYYQMTWQINDMFYPKEFTRNELEDSAINIEMYIMRKLREGLNRRKASYLLLGNGVGVPKGLLTYASGTNYDEIKQTTSEVTARVTWTDMFKLPKEVIGRKSKGKYLMNEDVFYDLLSDTDGMGKYQIGNQIQFFSTQDVVLSILGKELVFDFNMPTPASGSLSVLYGRFDEAYGVKTKPGLSIIFDDTKAKKITRTIRERMDGRLMNGQHLSLLKCKA